MTTASEGCCVLVVEDDPLLRGLAAETLREEGFATVEAADGDAALAALDGDRAMAAMLTDIRMPGMDGLDLAARARARHPRLGIVVTSGRRSVAAAALPSGVRFLAKPYTAAGLIGAVTAVVTGLD